MRNESESMKTELESAIFGGGCFWCLEAVFQRITGVQEVESGYWGGIVAAPSYEQVCSGRTGHAEVVRLRFDRNKIDYTDLLSVFFSIHDPTTLNRQGNDTGTQYRSVIVALKDAQMQAAKKAMADYSRDNPKAGRVVTELHELTEEECFGVGALTRVKFWPAESYHQNYFNRHPAERYCVFVVAPKVIHAEQAFPGMLAQQD